MREMERSVVQNLHHLHHLLYRGLIDELPVFIDEQPQNSQPQKIAQLNDSIEEKSENDNGDDVQKAGDSEERFYKFFFRFDK